MRASPKEGFVRFSSLLYKFVPNTWLSMHTDTHTHTLNMNLKPPVCFAVLWSCWEYTSVSSSFLPTSSSSVPFTPV